MAVKRAGLLALILCMAGPAHALDFSSLWLTQDQRGDRLLAKGDAAAAAKTYSDPRRRAYAEAKKGDFAAAARDLAPLDDTDAHYNRGNALARSGDLKGALAAYDRALAHDPDNADVRHNRDLVAQALEQPPKQQDPKAGDNQGGDQKERGDQADQNRDPSKDPGDAGQKGDTAQDEQGQQPKDAKDGDQQAQAESKPSSSGSDAQASPPKSAPQGSDAAQQDRADSTPPPESEADEAEQARRDAQAALARQDEARRPDTSAGEPTATSPGDASRDGAAQGATMTPQRTEQQMAQEQWLRRIPDDPGGLLRRKFEIEHLRRQRESGGSDEEAP